MSDEEIRLDLEELRKLHQQATRRKVKVFLQNQIVSLETKITNSAPVTTTSRPTAPQTPVQRTKTYESVPSYYFDQDKTKVTIYITANGATPEDTTVELTNSDKSFDAKIENAGGRNYRLAIDKLDGKISTTSHKIKKDQILLYLEKDEKKTWNDIAHKEQITDDNKSDDPSASLMNMMKKIYQEGDEETKKTIAKAWTETQSRQFKNT